MGMAKYLNSFWVFSAFAVIFSVLFGFSPSEVSLVTAFYAAVFAFRLPRDVTAKALFPIGMLFLFLVVLSEAPVRLFTPSLIYAAEGLVLFRGLLILLNQIQNQKEKIGRDTTLLVIGLCFEFALTAIFLYSTFKFVSIETLSYARILRLAPLLFFATFSTPLQWMGLALSILCFVPLTHAASVFLFVACVLIYGIKFNGKNIG